MSVSATLRWKPAIRRSLSGSRRPRSTKPGADAPLDGLDELRVFAPDLVVELDQLPRRTLGNVRAEEVVEETDRALRALGPDRADREVREARVHVDLQARPDEVELAVPVAAPRLAVLAPDLAAAFEPVRLRVDVHEPGEPRVRDRDSGSTRSSSRRRSSSSPPASSATRSWKRSSAGSKGSSTSTASDGASGSALTNRNGPHASSRSGASATSPRSSSAARGAVRSRPSSPYVHAW